MQDSSTSYQLRVANMPAKYNDLLAFYQDELNKLTEQEVPVAIAAVTAITGTIMGFDWKNHADIGMEDFRTFVGNIVPAYIEAQDDLDVPVHTDTTGRS